MASGSKKVIYAALIGNTLVAATKFVAAAFTGSSAMLSEGIHSLVDTGNQGLLLWGDRQAKKPADAQFPFGHGREIYFWSFVVAILIFALGAGFSIYEGIHHLLHPQPVKNPLVNYIVLGLAMVFEGGSLWVAVREFNHVKGRRGYFAAVHHGKDPTVFVVLFEDSAALVGLLIALAGIALNEVTGNPAFDGIASILIGVILGVTAIWLAYETKGLLIGESADPEIVRAIRQCSLELAPVEAVNEVLTTHMGPDFILVNASVDMADKATAGDIEKAIASFDRRIKSRFPAIKRVFVEAEARGRRSKLED
ncbi:MAG: cation diffusion facilitator family transporter [Desulfobacterales bacterium]